MISGSINVNAIGCGAAEVGSPGRQPRECGNRDYEAAEQRRKEANLQTYIAAPQLFRTNVTCTCGFTAGDLPPLLRSESQANYSTNRADELWRILDCFTISTSVRRGYTL